MSHFWLHVSRTATCCACECVGMLIPRHGVKDPRTPHGSMGRSAVELLNVLSPHPRGGGLAQLATTHLLLEVARLQNRWEVYGDRFCTCDACAPSVSQASSE